MPQRYSPNHLIFIPKIKEQLIFESPNRSLEQIIDATVGTWANGLAKEFERINITRETRDLPPHSVPDADVARHIAGLAEEIALKPAERSLASARNIEKLSCRTAKKYQRDLDSKLGKCDYRSRGEAPMNYRNAVASLVCRHAVATKLVGDLPELAQCNRFTEIVAKGMSGVWTRFVMFELGDV